MTTTQYRYLGAKPRTADHIGAVPNYYALACNATARGAVGNCTRATGHPDDFHQNGATGDAWVDVPLTPLVCSECGEGNFRTTPGPASPDFRCTNSECPSEGLDLVDVMLEFDEIATVTTDGFLGYVKAVHKMHGIGNTACGIEDYDAVISWGNVTCPSCLAFKS